MDTFTKTLLCAIDSAAFEKEIKNICLKSGLLLEAEKFHLENVLLLHLNQSGTLQSADQSHPGEYDPKLLLVEQVCVTALDGIKAGLSVNDVKLLTIIFLKLLLEITFNDSIDPNVMALSLNDIIQGQIAQFNTHHGLLSTVDYLLKVVICNCHIYNYLMSEEQEEERNSDHLTLTLVPDLLDLSSGTLFDEWERQQLLKQRNEKYSNDRKHLLSVHESSCREESTNKTSDSILDDLLNEGTEESTLNKAVAIVTQIETEFATKELLLKVKDNEIGLEYEIDKVNIKMSPIRTKLNT